ncbi:unnamed protein product [Spirodela intermedia]|uniref:Uncharacterized protein n=1 Tax=Spirodela intermedia TaxID=51605 RepID=A0A7I8JE46_SPIIN|nr:unnamed protein product [Spirodela intermedia]CAA6668387.1 unnamed protein product [Spirodela intermedia]
MAHVSDIKLIRTDTTLDLSQKAEKGMNWPLADGLFIVSFSWCCHIFQYGTKKGLRKSPKCHPVV